MLNQIQQSFLGNRVHGAMERGLLLVLNAMEVASKARPRRSFPCCLDSPALPGTLFRRGSSRECCIPECLQRVGRTASVRELPLRIA